ncbi:MAG: sulfurtransferase TusA family protein [Treponema sp.]|jgi:TusA-related sulfurtransferase|nr:sulfurtransferase TusA family protein [Treponema sp.]
MIEVDARGLSCPEPVMMTNSALSDHPGEKVTVRVDEACSLTNVQKFGKSKGKQVSVTEKDGEWEIKLE